MDGGNSLRRRPERPTSGDPLQAIRAARHLVEGEVLALAPGAERGALMEIVGQLIIVEGRLERLRAL